MIPIKMVDLDRQYQKIKPQIETAFREILDTTAFINGPQVHAFSDKLKNYLGAKHVIPCGNGTDALQIALMSLNLQPGDEVITPSFTFIATAEVIALLGLKPVFVDVDSSTFCMDEKSVKAAITEKTKAIVPVHLFGQSVDMEPLLKLAEEKNIPVIEDNAQAIGSDYTFSSGKSQKTGTLGKIGCTSFFPSKTLGCYGDGGAISTNDDELAAEIRKIVNHGQSKRYYHDRVGVNSRLDSLQAAVLNIKLDYLDEYIVARRNAAKFYDNAFGKIQELGVPAQSDYSKHTYHQYTLRVKNGKRDALHQYLGEKDIPAMIYYPVAAHKQKMFDEVKGLPDELPVTDQLTKEVISLPIHTELDEEQLSYIVNWVRSFFR